MDHPNKQAGDRPKDYFINLLPTAGELTILYEYFENYIKQKYEEILKDGGGPIEICDELNDFVVYMHYIANYINDSGVMNGTSQGSLDGEWYHLETIAKVIYRMDNGSKLTDFVIQNEDLLNAYNEVIKH